MNHFLGQIESAVGTTTLLKIEQRVSVFTSHLALFKFFGLVLTIFFLAGAVYFAIATGFLASYVERTEKVLFKTKISKKRTIRAWKDVQRHLFAGDDNSLKIAILEADKLLDEALKLAGYQGESLGDRLKQVTETEMPNLQMVWEAHKLRNRLAHETNFEMKRDIAERALTIYEEALRSLGVLE